MDHRGNRLPLFLVDQIRRLRRDGMSIRTIAAISGVAKSTVEIYCSGLPVPGEPQRSRVNGEAEPPYDSEDEEAEPSDADLACVDHDPLLDEYLADE